MKITCRQCAKSFSVPDHWDHDQVACPKCGAPNEVGSSAAPPAARQEILEDEDDLEMRLAPEEARPQVDMLLESTPVKTPEGRPAKPAASPPPAASAGGSNTGAAAPKKSKKSKKCVNCDAELPPDGMLCLSCGYHVVLQRVLQGDMSDVDMDLSTGVDRWFKNQLAEGESITSMLWAMHAVVAIVLSIVGLVFHPWAWYVVGPLALGYIGVCVWMTGEKGSQLGGRLLWGGLLSIRRRIGWRELAPPYAKPSCFVARDRTFGDNELGEIPILATVQVLDLEGSNITDKSLLHFQYCEKLRWVVVRDTRMTRAGVQRLQIMKPDVAIWHDEWPV